MSNIQVQNLFPSRTRLSLPDLVFHNIPYHYSRMILQYFVSMKNIQLQLLVFHKLSSKLFTPLPASEQAQETVYQFIYPCCNRIILFRSVTLIWCFIRIINHYVSLF